MIRVTIVPGTQSCSRMNGVTRYTHGILSHAQESLDVELRVLYQGYEMPAQEWLGRFSASRLCAGRGYKLNKFILRPLALYLSRSAVIHFPFGWLPTGWTVGSSPRIMTLHGASRLVGSWRSPKLKSWGESFQKKLHAGLSKLARVITVSQWSKGEVVEAYGLDPERVEVIPNGIDLVKFRPLDDRAETQTWLWERHGVQEPYLLYVGPCSPRKNTLRLVQAFGYLKHRHHIPHQLVLAGTPGQFFPQVRSQVAQMGLTDDVIFVGPVSDDTLAGLYNGAEVFVFPSLYEGFGLPVLEAMACGTPVVTSNCTALPEIAGGAAALVEDPIDVENVAAIIHQVLEHSDYQDLLQQRGLARARAFSWKDCATAHLKLYRRVAEENGRKHQR